MVTTVKIDKNQNGRPMVEKADIDIRSEQIFVVIKKSSERYFINNEI